jgi:molybdopterin-guanine dinucleotide biosynthesis protein A
MIRDSYGLVLCGGKSARMETDKCFLTYFGQPQWYHVYQMLEEHCADVFISCNGSQIGRFDKGSRIIVDDSAFEDAGPMSSLLSAFKTCPERDVFVVGCDYPFLSGAELGKFFSSVQTGDMASAFFNETENVYEPVIGWYSHHCRRALIENFAMGQHSLQRFLWSVNAKKYIPLEINSMMSVDTPGLMRDAMLQLKDKDYAGDRK